MNPTPLSDYLRTLLVDTMVYHKNTHVTPRLMWCQTVSKRQMPEADAAKFEAQLGKQGLTVIPRKVDDLYSWMVDLIVRAFDDLFRIEPTARPELSDEMKDKAVESVMATVKDVLRQRANAAVSQVQQTYLQMGVQVAPDEALAIAEEQGYAVRPDDQTLRDIVGQVKSTVKQYEQEQAAKGASALSTLVKDFLQQSDSLKALMDSLHDFCIYPYMVLRHGHLRVGKRREWENGKLVTKHRALPSLTRVSPFDLYWTPDATTPQNGSGLAERLAMRRFDIAQLKALKPAKMRYFSDQIDLLLNDFEIKSRDWLVYDENPHDQATKNLWSKNPSETVDVFRLFYTVSGRYLEPYRDELPKFDTGKQYQIEAYICDKYILGLRLMSPDEERPYYVESYEPIPSEFCGNALPETLMVINAASRRGFIHLIRNMGKSTNPSMFVNREMVGYETLDEDEIVLPDNQYDFIAALGSNGRPVDILEFPNYTNQILTFQEYLDTRADIESGIPKYALGQAAGLPSALRSTAALTLMIDNALKTIKSRVFRIGTNVVAPSIRGITHWVMDNWDDESVKVDSEVFVRGLEGVVTKSLVINKIQELLQYLAPFVQSGAVTQETIQTLINRFMIESGMETNDFNHAQTEWLQATQGAGGILNR